MQSHQPPRINAFPLFMKVADKLVVIVGSGEEALANARLIGQSSARIRIIAHPAEASLAEWATANG
ncbi:MAG: NAD(P)-dependent oxidoreductase, partial [Mesorhizobium sp.]